MKEKKLVRVKKAAKAYIKTNPEFKSMLEEKLKEFKTNKEVEE